MHDMLVYKVMPEWKKLRDPADFLNKDKNWPEIEIEQDTLITPGNAIGSKGAVEDCGKVGEDRSQKSCPHYRGQTCVGLQPTMVVLELRPHAAEAFGRNPGFDYGAVARLVSSAR
jgi:hypothetical protein